MTKKKIFIADCRQIEDLLDAINTPQALSAEPADNASLLPFLYDRITSKELLHSEIIAFLIDPASRHEYGTLFLQTFLETIGVKPKSFGDLEQTKVETEKEVDDRRRIDILLTCGNNAVIIENKLNDAPNQTTQLENYLKSIEKRKYKVLKIVFIPLFESRSSNESFKDIEVFHIYPKDLIEWLEKSKERDANSNIICDNYIDLLTHMNYKNRNYMMSKEIQLLDDDKLRKLIRLADVISSPEWTKAKLSKIFESVKRQLNSKHKLKSEIKSNYYLQIWFEDYKFWVEIYAHKERFDLYAVTEGDENESVPTGLSKLDLSFEYYSYNNGYNYFTTKGVKCYDYPSQADFNELISDTIKLLNNSK